MILFLQLSIRQYGYPEVREYPLGYSEYAERPGGSTDVYDWQDR